MFDTEPSLGPALPVSALDVRSSQIWVIASHWQLVCSKNTAESIDRKLENV